MSEAPDNEIVFLSEPVLDLIVHKQVQGAEVTGSVTTSYRQPCGRCGDELDQPLRFTLRLELKRPHSPDENEYEDDVGIHVFDGEHIDLEDIIQEHIILQLSPILLPPCTAKGACSLCDRAQNNAAPTEKNTVLLGDLLKLKGIKTSDAK